MQKILLTLCTVTLFLFVQPKAQAQEQPPFKKNLIGGSISFSNSNTKNYGPYGDQKATTINAGATYAYYFKKNVALGANLTWLHANQTYPFTNMLKSKQNSYSFSPFIRFDVPLWQSRFSIFNDLGIEGSYNKSAGTYINDTQETVSEGWGTGAFYRPGLMFRLKNNISLQMSYGALISYSYTHMYETNAHSFSTVANRKIDDLGIGVNFLF